MTPPPLSRDALLWLYALVSGSTAANEGLNGRTLEEILAAQQEATIWLRARLEEVKG